MKDSVAARWPADDVDSTTATFAGIDRRKRLEIPDRKAGRLPVVKTQNRRPALAHGLHEGLIDGHVPGAGGGGRTE